MLLHEHDREVLAGRFLAFVEVGLAAAELRSLGVVGQAHAHARLHVLLAVLGLLGRQDVAAGLLVGEVEELVRKMDGKTRWALYTPAGK